MKSFHVIIITGKYNVHNIINYVNTLSYNFYQCPRYGDKKQLILFTATTVGRIRFSDNMVYLLRYPTRPVFISPHCILVTCVRVISISVTRYNILTTTTTTTKIVITIIMQCSYVVYGTII